jgi:hypothetical protein
MRLALGWIALVLVVQGSARASEPGPAPMISYRVKVVETEGVGWRESVLTKLKPVTRQGAGMIWTVPADAMAKVVDAMQTTKSAKVMCAPKVTSFSAAPAAIRWRRNEALVTQAVWAGEELEGKVPPEVLRTGLHTTMIGRTLDQGILVRLVIEDTSIRAVHHVNVGGHEADGCCMDAADGSKDQDARRAAVDVPEIASQEVAGEWLIPRGEVLLVSFGAYTVADSEGKAVVKERLAMIEAGPAASASLEPLASSTRITPNPKPFELPAPVVAPAPAPAPVVVPKGPLPMPMVPSRTFPRGVHVDGTPAELPPLPADEAELDSPSGSAEPMPSPQTKKPQQAKPATDPGANQAAYAPARSSTVALPSLFMPTPSVGFQFLLPIKPLSLKLPFGQRLELEIYGRIVSEPGSHTPTDAR